MVDGVESGNASTHQIDPDTGYVLSR